MKATLAWVLDPYLHVFGIALLVAYLATQPDRGLTTRPASQCAYCTRCRDYHEERVEMFEVAEILIALLGPN